jgi:hypothetical protein
MMYGTGCLFPKCFLLATDGRTVFAGGAAVTAIKQSRLASSLAGGAVTAIKQSRLA